MKTYDGKDISLPFSDDACMAIPALVDPHVHFRFPGDTHKEDWKTAALSCINGGITTVCDMPNNKPSIVTVDLLLEKKKGIEATLKSMGLPLHFSLYLGAHKDHIDEIEKAKDIACAIKVFMGSSTGGLLIDDDLVLEAIFQKAARYNMVVAVHAEDEKYLQERKRNLNVPVKASSHSLLRDAKGATFAVEKAIKLAALYKTPLYILHVSTQEEIKLIAQAKKSGVEVYAEATPHHLYLSVDDYETLNNFAVVNPPLRTKDDQEYLWQAINDGVIDTIGTDHAPHTVEEKKQEYGKAPSGVPGVDTLLPLLLDAVHKKKLTLQKLVELTSINPRKILRLPMNNDITVIDPHLTKKVTLKDVKTKCGWSPYLEKELTGWPVATILNNRVHYCSSYQPNNKTGKRVN